MPRIPNIHGGGSLTNAHGLSFEQTTSLNDALKNNGYTVTFDGKVYNLEDTLIGYSKSKNEFRNFLKNNDVT